MKSIAFTVGNIDADQRVAIFLHGWGQSCECFRKTQFYIFERFGISSISYDLLGHGLRSFPSNTITTINDLVLQVTADICSHIRKIHSKTLIFTGISIGGSILMQVIRRIQCKGFILNLIASGGWYETKWLHFSHFTSRVYPHLAKLLFKLKFVNAASSLSIIEKSPSYGSSRDDFLYIDSVATRVNIIWGDKDWIHSYRNFSKYFQKSLYKEIIYGNMGHVEVCSSVDDMCLWDYNFMWSDSQSKLYILRSYVIIDFFYMNRTFSILSEKALGQLERLQKELADIEMFVEALEVKCANNSISTSDFNELAQVEARLNKIECEGVDSVSTVNLQSGKNLTKQTRKELVHLCEILHSRIETVFKAK